MTNIITQSDIANFYPDLDLSSYSATTVSGMIAQAQQRAASFCSVDGFDTQTVVSERSRALISNRQELVIAVQRPMIQQLNAIRLVKGSFSTSLTLSQGGVNLYQIPHPGRRIHFPNSYLYLTGTYLAGGQSQMLSLKGADVWTEVDYIGGYSVIPDDLKEAVILFFVDLVAKRNNLGGADSFSQGSYSVNYGSSNKRGESRFVSEAKGMLQQGGYVRVEIY